MDILYAVIPYYNFFNNKKRIEGLNIFLNKYKDIKNLKIVLVEGIVDNINSLPDFSSKIFKHKKYYYNQKIWIKENLINLAIKNELPQDWKYLCWLDADIIFRQNDWVEKTIDSLNVFDLVQMFDFALMFEQSLNLKKQKIEKFYVGYANSILNKKLPFQLLNIESPNPYIGTKGHCGFAWAINKKFFNKINQLWDINLIGGGDKVIAHSASQLFNEEDVKLYKKINITYSDEYAENLWKYYQQFENCKLSFINQQILVYWHGNIEYRKYVERHEILKKYNFNKSFIGYDNNKIYIKDNSVVKDIEDYMISREILN